MPSPQLILASASPRRRELLVSIGVHPLVRPADIDEALRDGETPERHVVRLATAKAEALLPGAGGLPVLAADTVVVCDDQVLGKPRDRDDGLRMLALLSDRWHRVLSAVSLRDTRGHHQVCTETAVCFRRLESAECEAYWACGEPRDKAGGYAIQGLGGCFVTAIRGSYSGVVGLPLAETLLLLRAAGIACGPEARAGG